ncbi:putative flippase GtrA [Caulobacter sp. BE264]|uniref:GtrA family protein n=1 Tax=Caulobacter sp. BE264 TaxID=2817724 RepID=UPI0028607F52|nr:GtrA family protein [Caulobacter sp. BE264]MDR7230415.1 putative flippase GtrA [Caulobacter sp. BE264]
MSLTALLTPARRDFLASALRYGLAGVINTLVGLSVILALDLGLGLDPHLANAAGYAIGICVSFALSKLFVFKARQTARSAPLRYVVAVAAAFALNQGVLSLAKLVLPTGALWSTAAQGLAVASYTAALFLLSHFWVFAHAPKSGKDA